MDPQLRITAENAARKAGTVLLRYRKEGFSVTSKTALHDRVTSADLEAERVIVETIRQVFPDHNILGEEGKYDRTASSFTWVIDPLDGTNNYTKGYPFYSVSVGLLRDDEPIIGAVLDPLRDELFIAERGAGAFCNGVRLAVSEQDDLSEALLVTGFYYDRGAEMVRNLDTIRSFFEKGIIGIRRTGSAALDLCYVAAGRSDGFWEFRLSPWDFLAGQVICEEAGGRISDRNGLPASIESSFIIASNGRIHEAMRSVIG